MEIGKEPSEQLLLFCLEVIKKTLFEMSQNRSDADMKVMANILQNDLNEKYHRLTYEDVSKAFHIGVREGDQLAINPRTWFSWLNAQKLKSNAKRIEISQDSERLAIEQKCQQIDKKGVLVEFLELCLIELYEDYCNGKDIVFQGVNQVYNWLELNGFILISKEEKGRMWDEVQEDIRNRKRFVHNEKKVFHPVVMCRERALYEHFDMWCKERVDLRAEVLSIVNNG
jgi:hypothetical protein